jgi:hypothetical protein
MTEDGFIELNLRESNLSNVFARVEDNLKNSEKESQNGEIPHPTDPHEPEIIIHKDGGRIKSIEIRCVCGKHTELIVEYDGD